MAGPLSGPVLALDMADRRAPFAPPPSLAARLAATLPPGWQLVAETEAAEGLGDGRPRLTEAVRARATDLEVYLGFGIPAELFAVAPRLGWVHSGAAGVRSSLGEELRASPVVFTSSAGVQAEPMAETVLAMILHFNRGIHLAVRGQAAARWDPEPWYAPGAPVRELAGSTAGVIGFGQLGRAVGRRLAALGARVVGLRRQAPTSEAERAGHDAERRAGGAERVLYGRRGLRALLAESDVVVICAPETVETHGMIGPDALAALRPGAVLVNVSRGGLVQEDALLEALQTGRLAGAALDVAAVEPLPSEHPLWSLPNVLITPHVSAVSARYWERETELILHNLAAYLAGEAERMRNVVDRSAGY